MSIAYGHGLVENIAVYTCQRECVISVHALWHKKFYSLD